MISTTITPRLLMWNRLTAASLFLRCYATPVMRATFHHHRHHKLKINLVLALFVLVVWGEEKTKKKKVCAEL